MMARQSSAASGVSRKPGAGDQTWMRKKRSFAVSSSASVGCLISEGTGGVSLASRRLLQASRVRIKCA